MSSKYRDRYTKLTELIDQVNADYMIELAMEAFGENPTPKSPSQVRARTSREKTSVIALCALRLLSNMEILSQGDKQFVDQFKRDFDDAVDAVGWLTGTYDKSDKLISETVELVLLSARNYRSKFVSLIRSYLGILVKNTSTVDSDIYSVGLGMMSCYLENQLLDEFKATAVGLIALSSDHNFFNSELHRAVVTRCLSLLVDVDCQTTLHICEAQKSNFTKSTDAHAAEFYWFFAYACQATGKLEDSLPLFLHCSKLCVRVEGKNSWLAARALQMYHRIMLDKDKTGKSEAFLWDFLKKAEEDYYTVSGEPVEIESAFVRYDLLRTHMESQTLKNHFEDLQKYLYFCNEYEDTVRHPRMTIRAATNMLSAYYLEIGDYLQAEQKMRAALNAIPPDGVPKMPSDDLIMSNLLHIYSHLNDIEQMEKLADMLAEKLDDDDLPDYERYRYFVLVQSAYSQLGYSMDEVIKGFKESLLDTYEAMLEGDTEELVEGGVSCAYSVVAMIATIGDVFSSTEKELRCYQAILQYFLDTPYIFPFNDNQLMVIYQELARINWNLNNQAALGYMQKSLDYGSSIVDFNNVKISNLRVASIIYYNMGYPGTAVAIAEESLKNITNAWHNVMSYINDHRICQVLATTQANYNVFYAVISAEKRPEYVYDQLLRYKDLPSLVGRERNRYLNGDRVDKKLRDRVYYLQDKLASAQMSDVLRGVDTVTEISYELQKAEAEFAKKFPRNIHYTEVSYERVGHKLKENEALIEYYFTPGKSSLCGAPSSSSTYELDIFVLLKENGRVNLSHTRLPNGEKILEDAAAFIDTMQNPNDSEWIGEKESLRASLHRTLLGFALKQLDHVTTLYIAPDLGLCNLPFEILYSDDNGVLQEEFRVCRLVCGRDLLFFDDSAPLGNRSFILGDPDFETERGEVSEDKFRHAVGHLELVRDLPFSGIEAQRVARRCRTTPYVGKESTKYALQEALPCRIIHLATHGKFDEKLESDSLYSSYLIFAGYNRWIKSKTQSKYCGNGILTADEISRMDLRNTELVVLSACNSGMGDYSYRSVKGLLSAFSAAGVRWVISHIWEAEDFTTPILMDAFYSAYLSKGMDVPEALQYAKNYLRTVTIGELRRFGWLDPDIEGRLSENTRMKLNAMREANDRRKPFMDESNWGGFVCYKCK